MSDSPEAERPDVLASDAEREAVVARLNQAVSEGRLTLSEFSDRSAAVYATRKQSELDQFVRDLPPPAAPSASRLAPVPPAAGVLPSAGGDTVARQQLSIGAIKRSGQWRLPAHSELSVSLGTIKLDLSEAQLESSEVVIRAATSIGTIKVVVPDNIRLVVEGATALGTRTVDENHLPPDVPAPTVRLRLDTGIGTVKVWVARGRRRHRLF